MILYHATYRANLRSIKQLGLGAKQLKNWEFSEDGVVCLAINAETAYSYAETAEDVPDYKYDSGIIVLATDSCKLQKSLLANDNNIQDEKLSYTYKGVIPPSELYVVTRKKDIVGRLTELKRIPAYE